MQMIAAFLRLELCSPASHTAGLVFAWRSGHIATIQRMHHIAAAYRGAPCRSPCFCFSRTAPAAARLTYISIARRRRWGGDGTVSAPSLGTQKKKEDAFCWLSSCLRCYPYAGAETPPPSPPPSLPPPLSLSRLSWLRRMGLPSSAVVKPRNSKQRHVKCA